ncbi:hypothetical protein BU17DRAFT_85904 [Hysterangium stoloniferum]|nr:hypothetical protein BU17DRAFT_85904 [Hysterangium stoloniferum]
MRVMDKEGGLSLKNRVILRTHESGTHWDMASTLQSICTLPAFHIYYPLSFLTQACTCTQQLLAACIAWLNSGLSRTKAPSLPIFNAVLFAAIPYRSLGLIGHVEVPCSNNPSVQSKVAPASDTGPEPSVE